MRAFGFKSNGGPELLSEIELPVPDPGPGQVLIKVAYAGVNFAEVQHRRGEFGEPDGPSGYDVPGLEVAGTVAAVGADVTGLVAGEQVAAYLAAFGGYAEFALAAAEFVRPTGGLPLAHAAGVPCVYTTAYGVLQDAARIRTGDSVLVHAAAGGVGAAAARVARSLGASAVYGTVGSPDKQRLADALGYDALFLRAGFAGAVRDATAGHGVDLVLDPIGGPVRSESLRLLAPFGRVAAYGDLGRHSDRTVDVCDLWKNNRTLVGFNIGDAVRRAPGTVGGHLQRALSALAAGNLAYAVPTVVPLARVADVHRSLEAGMTHGKTVLEIG